MPKRISKRRGTKQRRTVVSITPSESFNLGLARSDDALCLRGKYVTSFTTSATANTATLVFNIYPNNLGTRATQLATTFSRYRVKSLNFKFISQITSSGIGSVSLGLVDDAAGEGEQPTDLNQVSELRCSASNFTAQTIPTEFQWRPLDPFKWYYLTGGVTNSDIRLVNPSSLYVASTEAGQSVVMEVDYVIVFKGAAP